MYLDTKYTLFGNVALDKSFHLMLLLLFHFPSTFFPKCETTLQEGYHTLGESTTYLHVYDNFHKWQLVTILANVDYPSVSEAVNHEVAMYLTNVSQDSETMYTVVNAPLKAWWGKLPIDIRGMASFIFTPVHHRSITKSEPSQEHCKRKNDQDSW